MINSDGSMLVLREFTVTDTALKNFTDSFTPTQQLSIADDVLDRCVVATNYWLAYKVEPMEEIFNRSSYQGLSSFDEVNASWDWNNTRYPPAMLHAAAFKEVTFRYYLELANITDSFVDGAEEYLESTNPLEMSWQEWALGVLSAISEYEDLQNQTAGGRRRLSGEKPSLSAFYTQHPANDAFAALSPHLVAATNSAADEVASRVLIALSPESESGAQLEEWEVHAVSRSRLDSPHQRLLRAFQEEEEYQRKLISGGFQVELSDPVSVSGSLEGPNGGLGLSVTIANPLEFELTADMCLTAYPICVDGSIILTSGSRDFYGEAVVSIDVVSVLKKYKPTIKRFSKAMMDDVIEILGDALTIEIGFFSYAYNYRQARHFLAGGPKLAMSVGGDFVVSSGFITKTYSASAKIDVGMLLELEMWKTSSSKTTCRTVFSHWTTHYRNECISWKVWGKTFSKCWRVSWKTASYKRECTTKVTYKQHLDFDMSFYVSYDVSAGFFQKEGYLVNLNLL